MADLKFNPTSQKLECEYCLSAFTVEEWKKLNISEMEVHYKAQCFEGDLLKFQKKTVGDSTQICCIRPDGKAALYVAFK